MRNYLVASDLSGRSDHALARAAALARGDDDARITLLHVIDEAGPASTEAEDRLRAQAARVVPASVALRCVTLPGDPDETILRLARETGAALILMGVPRPRRFLQGLAGTTAERVLTAAACPVAVVRHPADRPWHRILLALAEDRSALPVARALDRLGLVRGADVTVLHATHLPSPPTLRTGGLSSVSLQRLDNEAMAHLELRLRRRLRPALKAAGHLHYALRHGAAPTALARMQREDRFDLLVTGARGQGALRRLILGSTSAEMIRNAEIDLICVPVGPLRKPAL